MIDEVYKVVNVLLNKNGYGVITPDEFNSVCGLAQSKIYSEIPNRLRMKYNRDKQGYSAIPKDILESTLYKLAVVEDLEKGKMTPSSLSPYREVKRRVQGGERGHHDRRGTAKDDRELEVQQAIGDVPELLHHGGRDTGVA